MGCCVVHSQTFHPPLVKWRAQKITRFNLISTNYLSVLARTLHILLVFVIVQDAWTYFYPYLKAVHHADGIGYCSNALLVTSVCTLHCLITDNAWAFEFDLAFKLNTSILKLFGFADISQIHIPAFVPFMMYASHMWEPCVKPTLCKHLQPIKLLYTYMKLSMALKFKKKSLDLPNPYSAYNNTLCIAGLTW